MVENMQDLVKALAPEQKESSKAYTAVVSHTDGEGVIWVRLPGADQDTPTASTSAEVKMGDIVTVEWRNNRLYIAGNTSDPAAGVVRVQAVEEATARAQSAADVAQTAAESAVADAETAKSAAESASTAASSAVTAASAAQASADNANEYASRALGNLSTVQSVAETLDWITQHGTMTLTSDVALDPTHVYFVRDTNGDYTVGSYHYSVVTDPDVTDIAIYYELSIDESLNNYVGTHLSVTSEGLWLLPDSGGNKVLIAVGGQGHTYSTAGTYIIDSSGSTLAAFTGGGVQIGQDDETNTNIDFHSLQLKDKEGNTYFHVSDLRNSQGTYTTTDMFEGDGSTIQFNLGFTATSSDYSVIVRDVDENDVTSSYPFSKTPTCVFRTPPLPMGYTVTATYTTESALAKAYSAGFRRTDPGDIIGAMSFAEGNNTVAAGRMSHAEGDNTVATGLYSHAEGSDTTASGTASHAEGDYTEATGVSSHSEGYGTEASGSEAHAEGKQTTASGYVAHAEGDSTQATASRSHAEGESSIASGRGSHAEGKSTTASASYSHAEGESTKATGYGAHAEGYSTKASRTYSHAQNYGTTADSDAQTAIGAYNVVDSADTYAFIIGNGTNANNRSNALTVDWSGNVEAAGDITDGFGNTLSTTISLATVLSTFYPVGSYYETSDTTFDPNTAWGGTWVLETAGQVHVSAGTGYAVSGAPTDTSDGGATSRTVPTTKLTDANMAHGHGFTQPVYSVTGGSVSDGITGGTHGHTVNYRSVYNGTGSYSAVTNTGGTSTSTNAVLSSSGSHKHDLPSHSHTVTRTTDGAVSNLSGASSTRTAHGHGSVDVMQPYIIVNRWHRTA